MTKLSVIIPVYNAEKYLKKCLDSVLSQSFNDFEIICINDCSTDNSLSILNEYANADNKIKILSNPENFGLSVSRNKAINISEGQFIHFLDADDWLCDKNAYEILVNTAINNNLDFLMFNNKEYNEVKQEFSIDKKWGFAYSADMCNRLLTEKELNDFRFKFSSFAWNKLIKKSLLSDNNIYFPNGVCWEDMGFTMELSLFAKNVMILPQIYYVYRTDVSTSIMANLKAKYKEPIKMFEKIKNWLAENELYEKYKYEFIKTFLFNLSFYFLKRLEGEKEYYLLKEDIQAFCKDLRLNQTDLVALKQHSWRAFNLYEMYTNYPLELNISSIENYMLFNKFCLLKVLIFKDITKYYLFGYLYIGNSMIIKKKLIKYLGDDDFTKKC